MRLVLLIQKKKKNFSNLQPHTDLNSISYHRIWNPSHFSNQDPMLDASCWKRWCLTTLHDDSRDSQISLSRWEYWETSDCRCWSLALASQFSTLSFPSTLKLLLSFLLVANLRSRGLQDPAVRDKVVKTVGNWVDAHFALDWSRVLSVLAWTHSAQGLINPRSFLPWTQPSLSCSSSS